MQMNIIPSHQQVENLPDFTGSKIRCQKMNKGTAKQIAVPL